MSYIETSIFDLFKIGPGPSSSHTIGPMKAASTFISEINNLDLQEEKYSIQVHLYGSLSATGKGHGTDRAVLAGLLENSPETVDPVWFSKLFKSIDEVYLLNFKGIQFTYDKIFFEKVKYLSPHPNTLVFKLLNNAQELVYESEFYSVGGGFIIKKGEDKKAKVSKTIPFPYATFDDLEQHLKNSGKGLIEILIENEIALSGLSVIEIHKKIDAIINQMLKAVSRGLKVTGELPGTIKLQRKAHILFEKAKKSSGSMDSFMIFLNSYCMAASEENASGNIVVTAPTSGASGVIPGICYLLKNHYHYSKESIREGLMVAGMIGFLIKHKASISGAEMGCMGEIGSASAMAAAMLTFCTGHEIDKIEAAAEIALEHHLGMTCDPVGGYVQIPCIERNAMGAIKAYNAYLIASSGNSQFQKISLDSVIKVMRATGKDMSKKYKETSEAGLALSMTEC